VLQPYVASTATYAITSMVYNSAGTITVTMSDALPWTPVAGDEVNISGATTTGTLGNTAVNGTFVVTTGAATLSTTNFYLLTPYTSAQIGTITVSAADLNVGTADLSAYIQSVESIHIGNSKVPYQDNQTGFWHWNPTGTTAVIIV
jgi:hypothetical protein